MDINQIQIPEKKKISITETIEEAWELYIYNLLFFIIYHGMWLAISALAIVILIDIPNAIAHRHGDAADKFYDSVFPYVLIISFIALTYFLAALIRAVIIRYEGKEHKFRKVMKHAVKDYFRYFVVLLPYFCIMLLGLNLMLNQYWLGSLVGGRVSSVISFVLLIPLYYLSTRYFLSLTAAIAGPADRSAFKTSAYLMKNNYCSGVLIILLISSIVYFVNSIASIMRFDFLAFIITLIFGSLFVISINVVYYKKLEAIKGIPAEAPELRKAHPALGLILAVVISLIPLWMLFSDVPRKLFYSNDFLVGVFSDRITFENGITIKRPAGWSVKKASQKKDDDTIAYYLNKQHNKRISFLSIKLKSLKNSVFRKDKLNPEELHQLKNILVYYNEDPYNCAYKISDTIKEMNNQQEYPKGIFTRKKRFESKENANEDMHIYFFRVVDNKYILIGDYSYTNYYWSKELKDDYYTKPENIAALPKEREEADAFLTGSGL